MTGKQWLGTAAAGLGLYMFCRWQNDGLTTTKHQYENPKLSALDRPVRVVQISDFHNKRFGKDQARLLLSVEREEPQLIFITGDLLDSRHTDVEAAMTLVRGLVAMAPVYYVSGNHELRLRGYRHILMDLQAAGVHVLENRSEVCCFKTVGFNIIGLSDPSAISHSQGNFPQWTLDELRDIILREKKEGMLNILLIHRPELFELYARCGMDLVFCGHAHGGQVRIPGFGGITAPNQGLFPQYSQGVHWKEQTTMIISRGIGNSLAPQRLNNRPELISVSLQGGQSINQ